MGSLGISQECAKEIAPLFRFSACNNPISSIFAPRLAGSPPPLNLPKRVPPVPRTQLEWRSEKPVFFLLNFQYH